MQSLIHYWRKYPVTCGGLLLLASTLLPFPDSLRILLVAITGVLLIVFGEHLAVEKRLAVYFIHREIYIPLLLGLFAIATGILHFGTIGSAFGGKIDIVLFIFCMAFLSHGLIRSGFFGYIAHHFVRLAQGNSTRLIMLVFILSSLLAYVTTNDIVVIAMTPIVFAIALKSRLDNIKLLLVGEFVGANVPAMGQVWGSPTNLIVALTLHISFFQYFLLMLIPTIVCAVLSGCALYGIIWLVQKRKKVLPGRWDWGYAPSYKRVDDGLSHSFTARMLHWIILFVGTFALTVYATNTGTTLLYAIIPATIAGIVLTTIESKRSAGRDLRAASAHIPYDVFFFSMLYFSLALELVHTNFVIHGVIPALSHLVTLHPAAIAITGTTGTSLLVNILNDLPSSAVLAEILRLLHSTYDFGQLVLLQSILVGLNLGACLTPVGALAGMIWLSIIRSEHRRHYQKHPMIIPNRLDLVRFSVLKFAPVAILTATISSFVLYAQVFFFGLDK